MNLNPSEEFARMVMAQAGEFRPSAYYDQDGDCIEFLASPDSFIAQRLDDLVTVYLSQDTGEVTGSLIKGIRRFLSNSAGLKILIDDGRIKLEHFLVAHATATDGRRQDAETRIYRKIIKLAESTDLSMELSTTA